MQVPLHILLIEDSEFDAELIAHALKKLERPFQLTRIRSEAELRHQLGFSPPDFILSDHGLQSFSGFKALEIVRQTRVDIPFIFVSGSNDQQMVVDMYERGATDYVFKRDIQDLIPAVQHALDQPAETCGNNLMEGTLMPQVETETGNTPVPSFVPQVGHLLFCPRCGQAHSEAGALVQLEQTLRSHLEVIVLRQLCVPCAKVSSKG